MRSITPEADKSHKELCGFDRYASGALDYKM
jgi:hypothetical protein